MAAFNIIAFITTALLMRADSDEYEGRRHTVITPILLRFSSNTVTTAWLQGIEKCLFQDIFRHAVVSAISTAEVTFRLLRRLLR